MPMQPISLCELFLFFCHHKVLFLCCCCWLNRTEQNRTEQNRYVYLGSYTKIAHRLFPYCVDYCVGEARWGGGEGGRGAVVVVVFRVGRGRGVVMVFLVVVLLNDRNISCFKIKEIVLFLKLTVSHLGITSM